MMLAHVLLYMTFREDFYVLIGAFAVSFVFYLLVIGEYGIKDVFYMAIALRLFWVFTTPTLSDDYFRFLWDGELNLNQTNVFSQTPSELIVQPEFDQKLHAQLYDGMNSKDYYSVYPPANQLYFTLSGLVSNSCFGRLLTLKILFFLTEFIGLFVLFKLAQTKRIIPEKFSMWALNPLVIIEGVGNLHFEVVMLVYVLLSVVYFNRNWWLSAFFYGIAISTKLLPLMFLPLFIPFYGWAKSVRFGLVAGGVFLLTFIPFITVEAVLNMWQSIDLYFQTFEFNASVFYIIKWIGELVVGWDVIQTAGPILAGITIGFIMVLTFLPKKICKRTFAGSLLAVSTVYLFMSTTVHPWYALIPFAISVFSKHKFPFWWTGLIFLSYSFYQGDSLEEQPLILWLEYGVLIVLVVKEIQLKKEPQHVADELKAT